MTNISGIPHMKTRVPVTLWYAALVVTLFSLSTSLIERDSDKTHQQANMASALPQPETVSHPPLPKAL